MVAISLDAVDVEFDVFDARRRRLFHPSSLPKFIGGRLGVAADRHVVVRALAGVDLKLAPGDRVGLIGHNGAGKSTLLRVLAGIYHPTRGTARIEGRVAPVFDLSLGLDLDATGAENIAMLGLINGLSIAEIEEAKPEIAAFTGLGEYLDLPARTYSMGMLARLQFAVATSPVRRPEILVVDEGIAAADAAFMAAAEKRLTAFMASPTILALATHGQSMIEQFCNRAILLEQGAVVFDGSVPEAFADYAKRLAAAS